MGWHTYKRDCAGCDQARGASGLVTAERHLQEKRSKTAWEREQQHREVEDVFAALELAFEEYWAERDRIAACRNADAAQLQRTYFQTRCDAVR